MAHTANAILHTPWDCRWSRFARRSAHAQTTAEETRGSLWECVHSGERVPVAEADCENCPFWEFQSPADGLVGRAQACERSLAITPTARHIELGVRLSLFVIAVIFAACGFVVLTSPLAVPFTVTMWFGAVGSFLLGIWGNFRSHADGSFRGFLPPRA